MLSVRSLTEPGHLVLLVLCLVIHSVVAAAEVTLAWDPNPEQDIVGYRLHYGSKPRAYDTTINAGNSTSTTLKGLTPGTTYFCAVTAYNRAGLESEFSSEISFTSDPPPVPPANKTDEHPAAPIPEDLTESELSAFIHGFDSGPPSSERPFALEVTEEAGVRYLGIRYQIDWQSLAYVGVAVERSLNPGDAGGWRTGETVLLEVQPSATRPGILEYLERSSRPLFEPKREFLRLRYRLLSPYEVATASPDASLEMLDP